VSNRVLTLGCVALSVAGAGLGINILAHPVVHVSAPRLLATTKPVGGDRESPLRADSLAALVVDRDIFRLARRLSRARYDPLLRSAAGATAPPTKPALACTGIVGDARNPTAVLTGLPGTAAPRVVQVGDHIGGLVIRAIARNHVTVTGLDTTWTLTVHEPWR